MLEMRFLRSGRRNQAFFRVVLTEKSKSPKSGFIKVLGWYNPHSKETSLNKEEILSWLDKGAKPSNNFSKLLIREGIKHKHIKFVQEAKKAPKVKDEAKKEAKVEGEKPTEVESGEPTEAPAEENVQPEATKEPEIQEPDSSIEEKNNENN